MNAPLPDAKLREITDRWTGEAYQERTEAQAVADVRDLLAEVAHYKASARQWETLARASEPADAPALTVFALAEGLTPAEGLAVSRMMIPRCSNH